MVYSHCFGPEPGPGQGLGPGKNGLYGFNKNLSHCTWTGTGKNTSIRYQEHFQDLKNGYQTHSSGPENVPGVLPCPCSGAVWKVLIKPIQPILPGPGPGSCSDPGSGPSQCEYTIRGKQCWIISLVVVNANSANTWNVKMKRVLFC